MQHYEADFLWKDFLWKVSLIVLNSGLILKTFTHVNTTTSRVHTKFYKAIIGK